jgi:hypothetical protein
MCWKRKKVMEQNNRGIGTQKKDAYRKWLISKTAEHKIEHRALSRKVKESVEEAKKRAWEEFGKELKITSAKVRKCSGKK